MIVPLFHLRQLFSHHERKKEKGGERRERRSGGDDAYEQASFFSIFLRATTSQRRKKKRRRGRGVSPRFRTALCCFCSTTSIMSSTEKGEKKGRKKLATSGKPLWSKPPGGKGGSRVRLTSNEGGGISRVKKKKEGRNWYALTDQQPAGGGRGRREGPGDSASRSSCLRLGRKKEGRGGEARPAAMRATIDSFGRVSTVSTGGEKEGKRKSHTGGFNVECGCCGRCH